MRSYNCDISKARGRVAQWFVLLDRQSLVKSLCIVVLMDVLTGNNMFFDVEWHGMGERCSNREMTIDSYQQW